MNDQAKDTKATTPGVLGRTLPGTGGDLAPDVTGHGIGQIPEDAGPREKRRVVGSDDTDPDVEGHTFRRPSDGGEYAPDGLIRRAPGDGPHGEG
jgi:hypothetical protein